MTDEKQVNTAANTDAKADNIEPKEVKEIVEEKTQTEEPKEEVKETKFDPTSLNLRSGLTVKVHQTIRETNAKGETKERTQIFEGRIIAIKHGQEAGATITVRKISKGFGVEKIFPLFSPNVTNIEIVKEAKIRRAKLYFLRKYKKRLKETLFKK